MARRRSDEAGHWRWRQIARVLGVAPMALALLLLVVAGIGQAWALEGVEARSENGYGRIVLTFTDLPEYEVKTSTGVVVLSFGEPVDISNDIAVALVPDDIPGYISAARADPDGRGLRFALSQTVTINTMEAGNRLFVDFLPMSWSGPPPGLPQDVIDELQRMAELEAEARRDRERDAAIRRAPQISLRLLEQPTFTRLAFVWDDVIEGAISRNGDRVQIAFSRWGQVPIGRIRPQFPVYLLDMSTEQGEDGTVVELVIDPTADVRGFAEGDSYIVDIVDRTTVNAAQAGEEVFRPDLPRPPDPEGGGQLIAIGDDQEEPVADTQPAVAAPGAVAVAETPIGSVSEDMPVAPPVTPVPPDPSASSPDPTPEPGAGPDMPTEEELAANDDDLAVDAAAEPAAAPDALPSASVQPHAGGSTRAEARRFGGSVRLEFPFSHQTPAAVFERHGDLWLVFDTPDELDVRALRTDLAGIVGDVSVETQGTLKIVKLRLLRRFLTNAAMDGTSWMVTIGDLILEPARPLVVERSVTPEHGALMRVELEGVAGRYEITDTLSGGALIVLVANGPPQSLFKSHSLVELDLLKTAHGLAIRPKADDISVFVEQNVVEIVRDPGLSLSADSWRPSLQGATSLQSVGRVGFIALRDDEIPNDPNDYRRRRDFLIAKIATSEPDDRSRARIDLAKVYLSNDLAAEALGLMRLAMAEDELIGTDPTFHALAGVARALLGRHDDALRDLSNRLLTDSPDAALWRGLVMSSLGRNAEALAQFAIGEQVIASYPSRRQRQFRLASARAALELNDLETAYDALTRAQDLATNEMVDELLLLRGRLAERLENPEDALVAYNRVIRDGDRQVGIEAKLRRARLLIDRDGIDPVDAVRELESLSVAWRGDHIELETLRTLAQLYARDADYQRAFEVMKAATIAASESPITRAIQDDMTEVFTSLYTGERREELGAIDALSLFYDFRELTPIGRRGDEVIRALSDRLIEVDLLEQAAHLLRHQVDNRLRGAAKAQVASRLAMVLLMDRKPEQALSVLARSRQAVLPEDIVVQRVLLEARALSETGRGNLAIELLETIDSAEARRMRADILWSSDRWQEAGEAFEALAGDAWRSADMLDDATRDVVLRSAIAYALAGEPLSLQRLRSRFIDVMSQSPDAQAFDIVTFQPEVDGRAFQDVVRALAGTNGVEQFLEAYRERYDRAPAAES
ncbi:MAG: hypothetical protein AAFX39_08625 [Pseudomonadota bacterium]